MTKILAYLQGEELNVPDDEKRKLMKMATNYTMVESELYKRGFSMPLLKCVTNSRAQEILREVHEGVCSSHIGGQALASKIVRAGYYWPTMKKDAVDYVRRCDKCQKHANIPKAPPTNLQSVSSAWPFAVWGVDILGPFPPAPGQVKFLLVAVDYFTKWIEAEPVATISAERVKKFYWKRIICRFGIPATIVTDNGTQFAAESVAELCNTWNIYQAFTSVEHPQTNGQAEAANKVVLAGLKKRLEDSKGNWAEELPLVLWSYNTTPQSSTGETPFRLTYGSDALIPIEILEPSPRRTLTTTVPDPTALRANLDLLDETRTLAKIKEEAAKQRAAKRYNSKVKKRTFKAGDLVLRRTTKVGAVGKLSPNWEGPFRVKAVLGQGAFKLEKLNGGNVPRSWNATNLRFYYS